MATAIQIAVSIEGSLEAFAREQHAIIVQRGNQVARRTGVELKDAARREVRSKLGGRRSVTGRGRRVENAIRERAFRNADGTVTSLVYNKFGRRERGKFIDYLSIHEFGATIRRRSGGWLFLDRRRGRDKKTPLDVLLERKNVAVKRISQNKSIVVRETRSRTTILGFFLRTARIKPRTRLTNIQRRHEARFWSRLAHELQRD